MLTIEDFILIVMAVIFGNQIIKLMGEINKYFELWLDKHFGSKVDKFLHRWLNRKKGGR